MSYAPLARLSDPARTRPELWRLALGMILTLAVMFTLSRALLTVLATLMAPQSYRAFALGLQSGATPSGLLVLLASMGFLGLGTALAVRVLHHRPARSLIGPGALRQGLRVGIALLVLNAAVMALPPWGLISDLRPGLHPGLWLTLLPLALAAILIQVGAEEVFFRGYLQSQLAARFRNPFVWLLVPSFLFGLGHHAPALFGPNALYVTLWAFAFGVAMADLTARTGSLGPAIAVHFVNNATALLFVSLQGEMSGLALFTLPFDASDSAAVAGLLPLDLGMILLSWLTARVALRV